MKFVETLARNFEEHGEEAIRIARTEDPSTYLRVISAILPKESDINDDRLKDLSDERYRLHSEFAADPHWRVLAESKAEKKRRHTENRLAYQSPYPKQAQFHEAGATRASGC